MTDLVTYAGWLAWLRAVPKINTTVLPDDSPVLPIAYQVAVDLVNTALTCFPLEYRLAVYNLATSNVVNFAPDQDGQDYFTKLREKFGTYDFVAGVISSSSDNGTSESIQVSDLLKNMSFADLQYVKDPWGRQYLAWAMRYGTAWGLT